jgi:hypothetical protein
MGYGREFDGTMDGEHVRLRVFIYDVRGRHEILVVEETCQLHYLDTMEPGFTAIRNTFSLDF